MAIHSAAVSIEHAQLVTVPLLDARLGDLERRFDVKLAQLEVKMEGNKSELVRWVFLTMLGNIALSTGAAALLKYFG